MLNAAKTDEKGPRGGARYKCSVCNESFGQREVNVDHIEPIVPIGIASKDMSWDEIVSRTFCSEENLQVICTECHKLKSKQEVKDRKLVKDGKAKGKLEQSSKETNKQKSKRKSRRK